MIIKRSLNNNVVITENEDGIEQVVCGRGIAFKKKPGDEIDESLINQVFVLMPQVRLLWQDFTAKSSGHFPVFSAWSLWDSCHC